MFKLQVTNWSHNSELQIVHGNVCLRIGNEVVIDEPLCIDVGLPSLLRSVLEGVVPNRWAPPEEWNKVPFFVCGCGDPECRAYSFIVRYEDERRADADSSRELTLVEVEEAPGQHPRELDAHTISWQAYKEAVLRISREFLDYIEGRDYRPLLTDTIEIVKDLMKQINEK
jgi:hypothetical protein